MFFIDKRINIKKVVHIALLNKKLDKRYLFCFCRYSDGKRGGCDTHPRARQGK